MEADEAAPGHHRDNTYDQLQLVRTALFFPLLCAGLWHAAVSLCAPSAPPAVGDAVHSATLAGGCPRIGYCFLVPVCC